LVAVTAKLQKKGEKKTEKEKKRKKKYPFFFVAYKT
jgi:hypothetical protein